MNKKFITLCGLSFLLSRAVYADDFAQNQICLNTMQNACGLQTQCRIQFLQTNAYCQSMQIFYKATQTLPLSLQQYQHISVVQVLQSQDNALNYFVIDASGRIIEPSAQLALTDVPGLLDLAGKEFILSNAILNFPEAVIVTENQQQLIFLQKIIDKNQNNQMIANAKVLYGFDVKGDFVGAKIIRVTPVLNFKEV